MQPSTLLAVVLVFAAAPLDAQRKADDARKDTKVQRPKDDAVTAKDKSIAALDKFAKKVSTKRPDWRTTLPEPPKQTFAPSCDYYWHWRTNHGDVKVRLRPDVAPMHVTSVIYLTRLGFYDGTKFHRAIKGFMAQGGCPLGNGTGNPGYRIEGETEGGAKHDKPGILSTANEGRPKTDGSQFFVTYAPAAHLDGLHTVFGEVVEGMETIKALEARSGTEAAQQPTEPLTLELAWVSVVAKPDPDGAKKKPGK